MSLRYVFIRVEGNKAVFQIYSTADLSVERARRVSSEVLVNERYCKKLYEDACRNQDDQFHHGPSFESRADLRRAFYAIHASKRKRHVLFDVKHLE